MQPGYGQEDARTIMERSRDTARFAGLESVTELHIINNRGSERVRRIAMVSRSEEGVEKRLIRFLEPADVKGTGLLIFDYDNKPDEMWMYLPALRKVRRIISSEKGKSFMGSEFSNADMAAPNLSDFHLKINGSGSVEGADCWIIEMVPVSEELAREYGYARRKVWIGKADYILRRAEYYDRGGQPVKVLTAGEFGIVKGSSRKTAFYLSIENKESGRKSWIRFLDVAASTSVNPAWFTTEYLAEQ